jgi:hypothetical protein
LGAAASAIILTNLNLNVVSFNHDFVALNAVEGRRAKGFTAFEIEFGGVPRTGYFAVPHFTLAQRPALMRAGIIQSEIRAIDIENGDPLAFDVKGGGFAGREIFRFSDFD